MRPTRRHLLAAAAGFAASLPACPVFAQHTVKVEGAWARPTVNGQAGGGGFLTVNGGASADRLLSASAGVSKLVELHTMELDGSIMRMRQIDAVDIPAGRRVELKPGGLHVMFIGLTRTLKAGDRFALTLRFEKAGEVKVDMTVMMRPPATAASAEPHKH